MQKLKDLDFRITKTNFYRFQSLTVFEKFWLPYILTSEPNPPRWCSKGLEPKLGKNARLRISYCSSAMQHADWTVGKKGGGNDWKEAFQLEAETERKFMKFLINFLSQQN